jgi:hypothetical protein
VVADRDEWAVDLERIDEPLDSFLARVATERRGLVVRRAGRPPIVIEPAAPAWGEDQIAFLREAGDRFADVPLDEIDRQVEQAITEVRRQRRDRALA